jgi:prophage DNA circulation protein
MCCLSIGHFVRARTSFSRLIALETGCCQSICCQQEIITFSTSIRIERISNEALCLKRVAVGIPSRRDITKLNTAKATLLSHTPHVESTNSCSSTSYANGGDLRSLLLELVEHGCLNHQELTRTSTHSTLPSSTIVIIFRRFQATRHKASQSWFNPTTTS